MADHYYGLDIGAGGDASAVAVATSASSKNIELRVRDGITGMNKTEIVKALEVIMAYIEKANAPA